MVYDGKTVIRYLRAHADELHIDSNKIAVWGPSSGGWLASFIAVTANNPAFEDKSMGYEGYSSEVNAVIDWCGPTANFLKMDEELAKSKAGLADHDQEISPESRFLGTQITKVPELCRLSAATTYVDKNVPPFCIFHGEIDQVVPVEQSIELAEKIQKVAGKDRVELHIEKGKLHHGHPWYHEKWVSDACINFLDRVFLSK
jgi:acetyl esterase/lipase